MSECESLDVQILRRLAQITRAIAAVDKYWVGHKPIHDVHVFADRAVAALLKRDDVWSECQLPKGYQMSKITMDVEMLIYHALSLGRLINRYRRLVSLPEIDWCKRAIEMDIEMKRKQPNE